MKVKSIFATISCFIALALASCDDDLNAVGGSIQPPADTISVTTDTVGVKARTVSMKDSVYARTINGVLGKYEDDLFGTIKSDYLCQYFFPEGDKFLGTKQAIDSVQFVIDFNTFTGDTLAPMGLSVYKVVNDLPRNFYTNTDPTKYIGSSPKLLASEAYTISGAQKTANDANTAIIGRSITADLGIPFGQEIFDAWKNKTFTDNASFNKFFKGTYVTTNFGSGSLIRVLYTNIHIYYKYTDVLGNYDNTKDTIRVSRFTLTVTPEVMQLNSIKNKNPEELFTEGTDATYLKTPAGVYTEVVFPIKQIKANIASKHSKTINTALFTIKGFTERESTAKYELGRPTKLLLINKDSVDIFFSGRQLTTNNKTAILGSRDANNIYTFSNIASLINIYKDMDLAEDPTFAIIPVEIGMAAQIDPSTGSTVYVQTGVFNYLQPSTSIIRNDEKNMRLELIYTKF
ncbi:uncharacterized protein DUF4270 [Dysgonomonas alginatilytica]|uniref:Uncharacterized protein DUF4270 n=1 Tax=Dysgonomonas alginatilytica TaxID=1605892 RepID=A0A2V3PL72_9BACT|nr:DUF4270 domain-containing protein [Dysgonomonas alginatilytica]PXV60255.1 uncharacterized protein DUF4270 [Dysgonomonas alginatilytica]